MRSDFDKQCIISSYIESVIVNMLFHKVKFDKNKPVYTPSCYFEKAQFIRFK